MNAASGTAPDVDVVVVGYGPVGAVLTGLLARRGVRVAAFERGADVFTLPRAAHFDAEIARTLQFLGAMDAILPATAPTSGMDFVDAEGRVLMTFETETHESTEGWQRSFMFYQPDMERALRARVAELLSASVHLEHDVIAVVDHGDTVSVTVRDLTDGTERVCTASYVVGCDGARSMVRAAMGTRLEDLGFDQPWLVVDVMLRGDAELPLRPTQYCTPSRPATFIPSAGRHRRWEFMLLPGEEPSALERPERIRELIAPWVDPDALEIIRSAVYSFHALIADGWRRGRVLLAGDAAHQMPPFLGQGMCAGIRDAANLEWKLHRALSGASDSSILDTYESERSPHVRTFIEMAVSAGRIIQTTDPDEAAARDAFLLDRTNEPPPTPNVPPIGPGLGRDDDAHRAARIVQPVDAVGARRDDVLGDAVTVVIDPAVWTTLDAATRAEVEAAMPVVATPLLAPWLAEHRLVAVVARPDRHVLASVERAEDLAATVRSSVRELAPTRG